MMSTPGPDVASHGLDTTLSLLSLLGVSALDAYGVPWTGIRQPCLSLDTREPGVRIV